MTQLADDFAAIRARRDELARERDAVQHTNDVADAPAPGHPEAFLAGHADAEMLHAIFPDAEKAAAHAEAISSHLLEAFSGDLILDLFGTLPRAACWRRGIELARGPDGSWSGTVDGHPIGSYPSLPTALDVARSLRAPSCR